MDTQTALSAHLLIVDDDPDTVRLMKHVLAKNGHRVSTATSGAEALACLETSLHSPDPIRLVLLDLMMPGIDGLEVLRRMRDNPRLASIPAIVVTAAYSPTQETDGLDAGADDFIAKPYQPQILLARVRTALRIRYAEETAGRAEALAHVLIEGMRDLVFVVDDQGRFSYVSPSA
jgi:DNA-binding response OmpR family regulator